MNKKINKSSILTEKDKRILLENMNICTDSHGKNCNITTPGVSHKNLN